MKKREAIPVNGDDIPEVLAFLMAADKLNDFKQHYAKVLSEMGPLVEEYNATLEAADKTMRAGGFSCPEFKLMHFTTKYNPEEMFNMLGRDRFLAIGGKIEQKSVYDVDEDRFEAAYAQGKLSKDIVDKVRTETPAYKKPKPIAL
jgi:hypothetical protein